MRLIGRLEPGQVIEHDEGQGADRSVFHPVILTATPGAELAWEGRVGTALILDVVHRFRLIPTPAGTHLIQSEHFKGLALWFFNPEKLRATFNATNAALKRRAEQPSPS